jgi:hypothetical protein
VGPLEGVVAVVVLVPTTLGCMAAASLTAHALVGAPQAAPQAAGGQPRAPARSARS